MNYKEGIIAKFPAANRVERSAAIKAWLNDNHPGWTEDTMTAEYVLEYAIGSHRFGLMDVEETEDAEEFILETYLRS